MATKHTDADNLAWFNEQILADAQAEIGVDWHAKVRGQPGTPMVHIRFRPPPKEWGTNPTPDGRWVDAVGDNLVEAIRWLREVPF